MVIKGFDGTYSSGNCSGFTPDSLFAPLVAETKTAAKITLIYILSRIVNFFSSPILLMPSKMQFHLETVAF
jgi:hypothetical protein